LSANLVPNFAVPFVRVTDPYGRILSFLDRSRYHFFQVAPELYPGGWVNPLADPLLLRIFGGAGNRTQTSGSVARNSDHKTTKVVRMLKSLGNEYLNIFTSGTCLADQSQFLMLPWLCRKGRICVVGITEKILQPLGTAQCNIQPKKTEAPL
jgi:hypothetical protein